MILKKYAAFHKNFACGVQKSHKILQIGGLKSCPTIIRFERAATTYICIVFMHLSLRNYDTLDPETAILLRKSDLKNGVS